MDNMLVIPSVSLPGSSSNKTTEPPLGMSLSYFKAQSIFPIGVTTTNAITIELIYHDPIMSVPTLSTTPNSANHS